jgi:hypothetical protein
LVPTSTLVGRSIGILFHATGDGKRGHMIRMDEDNMAVRSFEK